MRTASQKEIWKRREARGNFPGCRLISAGRTRKKGATASWEKGGVDEGASTAE